VDKGLKAREVASSPRLRGAAERRAFLRAAAGDRRGTTRAVAVTQVRRGLRVV
jgi:hypothetical protein